MGSSVSGSRLAVHFGSCVSGGNVWARKPDDPMLHQHFYRRLLLIICAWRIERILRCAARGMTNGQIGGYRARPGHPPHPLAGERRTGDVRRGDLVVERGRSPLRLSFSHVGYILLLTPAPNLPHSATLARARRVLPDPSNPVSSTSGAIPPSGPLGLSMTLRRNLPLSTSTSERLPVSSGPAVSFQPIHARL
jgi:hypothetical protein